MPNAAARWRTSRCSALTKKRRAPQVCAGPALVWSDSSLLKLHRAWTSLILVTLVSIPKRDLIQDLELFEFALQFGLGYQVKPHMWHVGFVRAGVDEC